MQKEAPELKTPSSPVSTLTLEETVRWALILLWLLLFGGRWLLAPLLQANGLLSLQTLNALDQGPLLRLYLLLFVASCAVAGWQWAKNYPAAPKTLHEEEKGG